MCFLSYMHNLIVFSFVGSTEIHLIHQEFYSSPVISCQGPSVHMLIWSMLRSTPTESRRVKMISHSSEICAEFNMASQQRTQPWISLQAPLQEIPHTSTHTLYEVDSFRKSKFPYKDIAPLKEFVATQWIMAAKSLSGISAVFRT